MENICSTIKGVEEALCVNAQQLQISVCGGLKNREMKMDGPMMIRLAEIIL